MIHCIRIKEFKGRNLLNQIVIYALYLLGNIINEELNICDEVFDYFTVWSKSLNTIAF